MTTTPPIMTEVKLETPFYVLFHAIQSASLNEIQLNQLLHEHRGRKKDEIVIKELAELTSVVLPEKFGRLIATLDLQNAFLSLGKYVRNFGDAKQVLDKLQELMDISISKQRRPKTGYSGYL